MNKFWTPDKLKETGRRICIAVGTRTGGKTYSLKKEVLEDFFLNNKMFVWSRKTVDETEKAAKSFLGDMNKVIKELIPIDREGAPMGFLQSTKEYLFYKVKGQKPVIVGHFIPLSTQHKYKSVDFTTVQKLVFDEFLVFGAYLPNETILYRELVTSVERVKDDFEIWMLSNSTTFNNPYFRMFEVGKLKLGINIIDEWKAIEILDDKALAVAETRQKTLSFHLGSLEGGQYNDYAYGSKFAYDNYNFVKPYKGRKNYLFSVKGNLKVGIWQLPNGKLYFSEDLNKVGKCYSLLRTDYSGEEIPLGVGLGKKWIVMLAHGKLQFETFSIKTMVVKYLRSLT